MKREEYTDEELAEIREWRLAQAEKYARCNGKYHLTITAEDRENAGLDWSEPSKLDFEFELEYLNY